ncbi:NAD(P)/FAD-dependent oxidoreductase [Streptomyces sp. C10-9-1]|uniref:NAD(P)/FAD-dependent oxidoreductase n=1 Tax=Streptomyces sp. C10-9-1 TaxID=1859285 RepID=UPI003F4A3069
MSRRERAVDALVVGAGPAGLAAAAELAAGGAGQVEVLDHAPGPGGLPVQLTHRGFGPRRSPLGGPAYVRPLVRAALEAGAALRPRVLATGSPAPGTVDVTHPGGLERITARAVVLATGGRERPRGARLIPGTRPEGVLTAGELLRGAGLHHRPAGRRAVVAGTGPGALAAVRALREAGTDVVALVTGRPEAPLLPPRLRVPVLTSAAVAEVTGADGLSGVLVTGPGAAERRLDCDILVLTGEGVPECELARLAGAALDPATRGPAVDTALRTALAGVFAAGDVLRGGGDAPGAAAEGRHAARAALRHLAGGGRPAGLLRLEAVAPLEWITPGLLPVPGEPPPRGRFTLSVSRRVERPVLLAEQDGRPLGRWPVPHTARPDRPLHLYGEPFAAADPLGGPVRVRIGRTPSPAGPSRG